MNYDFKTLSPADFEDLARDLASAEYHVRFEGFGPGPDGGIDGRHSAASGSIILQAKHRVGSSFSSLTSTMRKERNAIERLKPKRYILATSQSLTPTRKDKLKQTLKPFVTRTKDILGATDLNDLLRKHPNIEKGHIKLWLSSTAVLERLLNSARVAYTEITEEEILAKVKVYAQNPSFDGALHVLEERHVVIVSGAPGVGKTTLAQILAYAFMGEGWELVAIKNLDDGFAAIDDSKRQIFFFDDFLGKIALDKRALASKDTDLVRFLQRVQRSKNARFILTTRAYIYEEARNVSESIGDKRLDITKYVLDVGVYTRRVRARILYNHLVSSGLEIDYVTALVDSGLLPKIVDHENYNPRIIEWMTDSSLVSVPPVEYAGEFLEALNRPFDIWDRAFREHIPPKAQHCLICLFFSSQSDISIDELREAFDNAHTRLCAKYQLSSSPTDFEDSIQLLEGSFIEIGDGDVSFVNPSVRDYLSNYLSNEPLLSELARAAPTANWASSLWEHFLSVCPNKKISRQKFAKNFLEIGAQFDQLPTTTWQGGKILRRDLALSERIKLLVDWYQLTGWKVYSDALLRLAASPPEHFSPWNDGADLVDFINRLRFGKWKKLPESEAIADHLENALNNSINYADVDDLHRIMRALQSQDSIADSVQTSFNAAVKQEIDTVGEIVSQFDSEPDVEDHLETLTKLASWTGQSILDAKEVGKARIDELGQSLDDYPDPDFTDYRKASSDFDDEALKNLFESLVHT